MGADSIGLSWAGACDTFSLWTRSTPPIEEFVAEGYTHIECFCLRCRIIRLRPMGWLPRISMGLALAQLSTRLRCAECGGSLALQMYLASLRAVEDKIRLRTTVVLRKRRVRRPELFA